jgi:lipid A 4'-phosphatase
VPSIYVLCSVVLGVLFIRYSRVDLTVTGRYWDPVQGFYLGDSAWAVALYEGLPVITITVAVLLLSLLGLSLVRKQPVGSFTNRALVFLVVCLATGPGLIVNWVFKDHWGRPRPRDVVEFGGSMTYMPALVPGGMCERNCSFVAGHPSTVFWMVAFGFLLTGAARYTVFALATSVGFVAGAGRIVQGAHFLSDVVFSFVFTFAVVYGLARWVFKIPPSYGRAAEGR